MKLYKEILILMLFGVNLFSQEELRPLSGNINLPNISPKVNQNKKVAITSSLKLPFFDDFSYAYKSPYPSVKNWSDSSVYINSGFGIAPISLGVATFDGLNKKGYPYAINAPVSYSGPADFLTSNPINLKSIATSTSTTHYYSPADSIFLSFYYQAEGFGEAPEPNDSICVDFFKPRQNKWKRVWGKAGYNPSASDTSFYRVKIPIADTAYCDSLFKFRFRNNATTSGSLDHWHIDYVQIKSEYYYYDTINNDVAFVYKPSSFLKNYSVIPYRQYIPSLEKGTGFRNYIRNNFKDPAQSLYSYSITTATGSTIPTDSYVTIDNPGILPFANNGYFNGLAATPIFTLQPFQNTFSDSTFFTIRHTITNTAGDIQNYNDTLSYIQKFSNYFAYDDGTAEQGYYLNTYGAKTAMRFTLNVPDTLKSVRIYFDPILDGNIIQGSAFRLMVWNSPSGVPSTLIYKDSLMYPEYLSGEYNLKPTYPLTSCLQLGAGTYFIGIQQITNKGLNIGFDRNTNHKDALYYDIGNGWVQSSIPGSLMINPVLGCVDPPIFVGLNSYEKTNQVRVFPNPAQNVITVSMPGNQLETSELEITNALGQTVFAKTITSNEEIDIRNLSNGLYFIHLKGNSLNISSQKLIISR